MTKVKLFVVLFVIIAIFAAKNADAILIPLDEISVTGTTCTNCTIPVGSPEATIDGDVFNDMAWTKRLTDWRSQLPYVSLRSTVFSDDNFFHHWAGPAIHHG